MATSAISLPIPARRGARSRGVARVGRGAVPPQASHAGVRGRPTLGGKARLVRLKKPCVMSDPALTFHHRHRAGLPLAPTLDLLTGSQRTLRAPRCWLFDEERLNTRTCHPLDRHGRTWSGHPRLQETPRCKDVDPRDDRRIKSGDGDDAGACRRSTNDDPEDDPRIKSGMTSGVAQGRGCGRGKRHPGRSIAEIRDLSTSPALSSRGRAAGPGMHNRDLGPVRHRRRFWIPACAGTTAARDLKHRSSRTPPPSNSPPSCGEGELEGGAGATP